MHIPSGVLGVGHGSLCKINNEVVSDRVRRASKISRIFL